MSLQPPEYWLKMHNIELQQLMAQAERTRQRSRYQGNGTALRSPGHRAKPAPPVEHVVPVQPKSPSKPSDNRALAWFRRLV
ncbi:MAG TPA: hypothetical protein VHH13_01850, partial [Arthrobacter sp.]|nr:hypothetical protein [Arthrobacter sp.]